MRSACSCRELLRDNTGLQQIGLGGNSLEADVCHEIEALATSQRQGRTSKSSPGASLARKASPGPSGAPQGSQEVSRSPLSAAGQRRASPSRQMEARGGALLVEDVGGLQPQPPFLAEGKEPTIGNRQRGEGAQLASKGLQWELNLAYSPARRTNGGL